MKILVTGVSGQLGYDVVRVLKDTEHEVFAIDRENMDITDEKSVKTTIFNLKPDAIIHCAAYTNVDGAESDQDNAYKVNALGTKYLALAAKSIDAKMLYVSTDYVFDGTSQKPYDVHDPTNPLNVYGKTKLAGENFVKSNLEKSFIVRTSWVFGKNGKNFVKTMLRLGKERGELSVVADQIGSPTYTLDLAKLLIEMIETEKYGTYHATNSGTCSWYDFAVEIFKQANVNATVNPIKTEQYPTPAKRPKNSVLSKEALCKNGFSPLRDWQLALNDYLKEIEIISD